MSLHWLGLIAAVWLQSINGTNSNFPAYSSELKRILSISQLQLNNLAFASDAGKLLGWIPGLAAAHLPLWLLPRRRRLRPPVPLPHQSHPLPLLLADFLPHRPRRQQHLLDQHRLLHPRHPQLPAPPPDIAVGISTSYVGLSAKIYTAVVGVAAADPSSPLDRAKTFLLLNSVLPLLVCVAAAPLTRDANVGKSRRVVAGFVTLFVITVVTGCFAVATSLISPSVLPPAAALVGMVVFLVLPLAAPAAEEIGEAVQQKCLIVVYDEESLKRLGLAGKGGEREGNDEGGAAEIPPLLMLGRAEFWLYCLVYLFGATLGFRGGFRGGWRGLKPPLIQKLH